MIVFGADMQFKLMIAFGTMDQFAALAAMAFNLQISAAAYRASLQIFVLGHTENSLLLICSGFTIFISSVPLRYGNHFRQRLDEILP